MAVSKDLRFLHQKITGDMRKIVSANEKSGQRADWKVFDALDASASVLKTQIEEAERREAMEKPMDLYTNAFGQFLRHGLDPSQREKGINPEQRLLLLEHRDMGTGGEGAYPLATSGFLAPASFANKFEAALKYTAPMLDVCSYIDSERGTPMGYPTDSDINTIGEQVNEGAQVTTADVPLSQAMYRSFKYSSKLVKCSIELLQDSAFDLETYLSSKFAFRIGRALNPLLTNGSGVGCPLGLLTNLPIGVGPSTTPAIIGDDTEASPNPSSQVGYLDLVNLEQSVDPIYRIGAVYMMHPLTLAFIKSLKDKNERPLKLWREPQDGAPFGTVNGYAVYPNCDFPALAAGNVTVTFGRHDKYCVRRAGPMWVQRLSQRFAEYGQVAFIGWARRDGMLLDAGTHPVMALQQHS